MNDKQMLKFAAKAAGYEKSIFGVNDWFHVCVYDSEPFEWELWNPLTDDGDALRLAVKLELEIISAKEGNCRVDIRGIGSHKWSHAIFLPFYEQVGDDPYAATRRAITRAAAEIGRVL